MIISLGEVVNVRNIVELKDKICSSVSSADYIRIDIEKCTEIDLSGLQLIEAARIHATSAGKPIGLTLPANAAVEATLARAGLTEKMTPEDRHFWFHKED